ncbi:MAG: DUF2779 domain-containing protein, partial [Acidobacteria bacterium]|nr:DUF2779 domain-containing protein [Acidobacteriota bacterium]
TSCVFLQWTMDKLTKTRFRKFLECPREFWLAAYHPEAFDPTIPPDIAFRIRQGYEVERIVKEYLKGKGDREYEFQTSVETQRLIARFDVFVEGAEDQGSQIYEIKSSKFIDPAEGKRKADRLTRLYDVGFQVFAAREAGINVSSAHLVTLNGDYRLEGALDAEGFLVFEDVTDEVNSLHDEIGENINLALKLLDSKPPDGFENLCSKKLKCEYFEFEMPDLPHPTIFDIPRLHKKKASMLLGAGILDVREVPEDFPLTETQRDFVDFVKKGEKSIDRAAILERLDSLEYPLYFLDYETVNPSIPQFEGMSPLQQITFQHSLHVLESPDGELIHHEHLSDGAGIPPREIAEHLASVIGDTGSVLVWYKHFEMARNREMGELFPEYAAFFESVNERIFDLYEIFSEKLYRDPALKNNSLKSVLPLLVPELTYDGMNIGNGGLAMSLWYDEVYCAKDPVKKTKTMSDLKEYCCLDTLAMVRILEVLGAI